MAALTAVGCGSPTDARAPRIERSFDVHWHDAASAQPVHYAIDRIVFHDGRWRVRATVTNSTKEPLFEATWSPPGDFGVTWNGPALVYSGIDVLGQRRLIYVPADKETPDIASPLRPGATWRGTIEGKIPTSPALPRAADIWVRYPVFGIGQPWDGVNTALAVQWISAKAIRL
ncbi:MAG: hypothetical protein ACJ77E_13200 [Gaiellaceae bacterium]